MAKRFTISLPKDEYVDLVTANRFNFELTQSIFGFLLENNLIEDGDIPDSDNETVEDAAQVYKNVIKRLMAQAKGNVDDEDKGPKEA